MTKLAFIHFIRSGSVKTGLLFILAAGLVSLLIGKQFIQKTEKTTTETARSQKEHIKRYAEYNKDDIGLLLYYIKFSIVNQTPAISGLAIGQRDVNPGIKSVTIRALEAQKYDADLNNPYNGWIGNLDFSFVLVFLFPLLIIAFTYTIVSEERESGTWRMVVVQSSHPFAFILRLFAIRLAVVGGALLLLFSVAIPFLNIPLDAAFWAFASASFLYVLVWLAVCFWVVSLQKSSSFNAVALLSVWIMLLIVLPACLNNYLTNAYPVPEALETTLKQRKGYHEKWDLDKRLTMDRFYAHYPQFKQYPLPDKEFSWLWYYAMQQMGDDEAAKQAKELQAKLEQRNRASARIAQFIPTLHLQFQLNEIAQSGLGNQLRFLDKTTAFHEKLRLYFYPKIFTEFSVQAENWGKFEIETFTDPTAVSHLRLYVPFLVFVLLFGGLGWANFRRNVYGL